jgi:hypothetical protein
VVALRLRFSCACGPSLWLRYVVSCVPDARVKEVVMDKQTATTIYEAPVLVEVGEFGEDTLGSTGFIPEEFVALAAEKD